MYKSLIRPRLDYGNISYNKLNNEKIQNETEKLKYRASLAISGAMQRTLKEKSYDELGSHSLTKRRWLSKPIFFYKMDYYWIIFIHIWISFLRKTILSDLQQHLNSD